MHRPEMIWRTYSDCFVSAIKCAIPKRRSNHEDANVSDVPTEQTLLKFDRLLQDMNMRIGDNSPIKQEADLVRLYFEDRANFGVDKTIEEWNFLYDEVSTARVTLERITAAATALRGVQHLRTLLKEILEGSLTQDFQPSASKDKFYELELASILKLAGFSVELREPDIVVSGNGLGDRLAIACKYPFSRQQIHEHINNGYRQITRQEMDGVVSLGMELIVAKEMKLPSRLDFRKANRPPLAIMEDRLNTEVRNLQVERARDYPSERPLDGLMLTLSFTGIDGDPPMLTNANSLALGCQPGNPLRAALEIVKRKVEEINR